jgi:serine/threonine-protein kinase
MNRFGRFRDLKELGGGGFARVYQAWDSGARRHVALKIPHLPQPSDRKAHDRFRWEVWALQQLRHPNIVPIYDAGDVDGRPFLAMELLAGPSLAAATRGRPHALDDVARWAVQMAAAIDAAHAAGIVHGDIKPGNFLFAGDGRLVLTDFGIGRSLGGADSTATDTVVGTLRYLAPECWAGEAPGAQSDIYAFGVLLYELLAGAPPYAGDIFTLAAAHYNARPRPLTELRPDLPAVAWAALAPALARRPAERPDRAASIAHPLAAATGLAVALEADVDRTERIPLVRLRPAPLVPAVASSPPPGGAAARRHGRLRFLLAQAVAVPLFAGLGAALMMLYLSQDEVPSGASSAGASPGPPVVAQQATPTPAPTPTIRPSVSPTPSPSPPGLRATRPTPRPTATARPTPTPTRTPLPTQPPWWARRR